MKTFEVTLTLLIDADDEIDARRMGIAAGEHIRDTFDSGGTIRSTFGVHLARELVTLRPENAAHRDLRERMGA